MVTIVNGNYNLDSIEALYFIYRDKILSYLTEEEFFQFCKIDNITSFILDAGVICNQFGRTSIDKVSTGLKTVLIANYYAKAGIDKVINSVACGPNALKELLLLGNKYNLTLAVFQMSVVDYYGDISYKGKMYKSWYELVDAFDYDEA